MIFGEAEYCIISLLSHGGFSDRILPTFLYLVPFLRASWYSGRILPTCIAGRMGAAICSSPRTRRIRAFSPTNGNCAGWRRELPLRRLRTSDCGACRRAINRSDAPTSKRGIQGFFAQLSRNFLRNCRQSGEFRNSGIRQSDPRRRGPAAILDIAGTEVALEFHGHACEAVRFSARRIAEPKDAGEAGRNPASGEPGFMEG